MTEDEALTKILASDNITEVVGIVMEALTPRERAKIEAAAEQLVGPLCDLIAKGSEAAVIIAFVCIDKLTKVLPDEKDD